MTEEAVPQEIKLSEQIINEIKALQPLLSSFKSVKTVQDALNLLHTVVQKIEQFSLETKKLSSDEKLKTAVEVLNFFVDIPYVPEFIEERVISLLICSLVTFLNSKFGKDWFEKIKNIKL